jgi:hypothetical protein
MSPITGKLRLAFSAIRDILRNNKSGYSAVWSSAFDWGSKGREFKSLYPDHFKQLIRNDLQSRCGFLFFIIITLLSHKNTGNFSPGLAGISDYPRYCAFACVPRAFACIPKSRCVVRRDFVYGAVKISEDSPLHPM